jgi:hypothetical protein
MRTHYRIEETAGSYYFPWVNIFVTYDDAKREMDQAIRSGRANPQRIRIVKYVQTGWGPPERVPIDGGEVS